MAHVLYALIDPVSQKANKTPWQIYTSRSCISEISMELHGMHILI